MGSQPTYEGLKLLAGARSRGRVFRSQPTYEGLKHLAHLLAIALQLRVPSLPMRD